MAALCGTDVSQYHAPTMVPVAHPHRVSGQMASLTLGHEVVGTIVEMGSGVEGLSLGQRVVPGSGWWCGECDHCLEGRSNICAKAYLYGIHANGGLAEFASFPANMCVPVSQHCPLEAAVMGQACAVALHALDRASIGPGESVALFGIGEIGSLVLAVWDAYWMQYWRGKDSWLDVSVGACAPIAVDRDATRLAIAAALGVTLRVDASLCDPVRALLEMTGARGVDIAIDATGDPTTIGQALATVKRGGRLLQMSIPSGPVSLPLGELVVAEKAILTTNGQICEKDLPRALHVLAETDVADLVGSQVIALEDLVEHGLRPLTEHRASAKILVRIPHEAVLTRS
jgi:(R,R)-butanediol dehydrogenase / meso-butanediol dehydrogenase / diacetyl reductase